MLEPGLTETFFDNQRAAIVINYRVSDGRLPKEKRPECFRGRSLGRGNDTFTIAKTCHYIRPLKYSERLSTSVTSAMDFVSVTSRLSYLKPYIGTLQSNLEQIFINIPKLRVNSYSRRPFPSRRLSNNPKRTPMEDRTYTSQQLSAITGVNYGALLKSLRDNGHFYGVTGKIGYRRKIEWSSADLEAIKNAIEVERQYYLDNPEKKMPKRLNIRPMKQRLTLSPTSLVQLSLSTSSIKVEIEWQKLLDEHLKKSFKAAEIDMIISELNQFGRWQGGCPGGVLHLYLMGN